MLKLCHGRPNADQAKVAEILTEFSELHTKVKVMSHRVLASATGVLNADKSDKYLRVKRLYGDLYW